MDWQMVEDLLQKAEEHVASGKLHIARQRQIIADLQYKKHDSTRALELLATLEDVQKIHEASRDRAVAELRQLSSEPSEN
jgi:hypothetical protein